MGRDITELVYDRFHPTEIEPSGTYLSEFRSKRYNEGTVAEVFHENTKITPSNKTKAERSSAVFLSDDDLSSAVTRISPDYEGYPSTSLVDPEEIPTDIGLFNALNDRRSAREYTTRDELDPQELSNLLYHSAGISGWREDQPLRRYPSAGNLYPVEIYFHLSSSVGDLLPGAYYYVVRDHSVRRLPENLSSVGTLFADADEFDYSAPELTVFVTAAFWRAAAKYGPRGYRYVLQESGHLGQNLQLVSRALGFDSVPRAGYVDARVNDALGIDGVNEAVVYSIVCGTTDATKPDT